MFWILLQILYKKETKKDSKYTLKANKVVKER